MSNNDHPFHFLCRYRYCPLCGSSRFVVNGVRSRRCEQCDFELFQNASASVAAFIIDENSRLLVCRRAQKPAKGTLDLPGGFVDPDETLEQALDRELTEELCCRPQTAQYLFSLPNRYMWKNVLIPTIDCFFLCSLPTKTTPVAHDDVEAFCWMPLTEVNPSAFGLQSIAQAVKQFIEIYNNQQ